MFGKMKNGQLMTLPRNYFADGITIFNFNHADESVWREHGFKPVVESSPPDNINLWKPVYTDSGEEIVVERWELTLQEIEDVAAISFVQAAQEGKLDDMAILENAALFPIWDKNFRGKAGTIMQYKGNLYRLLNDITTSQENKKPSKNPALWEHIGNPSDEYHEWLQPIGINDSYQLGARVLYGGKQYESVVANNIWQPDVYGWEEVV